MNTLSTFPDAWPANFDPWNVFVQIGPHMVDRARSARLTGDSHRGFQVGAAAYVLTEFGAGIIEGANFKPYEDGPKECAEQAIVRQAHEVGVTKIIALVVSGPPQVDEHSGLELPTLHPCGSCRELLFEDPIFTDETLITTVDPAVDAFEIYNRRELATIHDASDLDVMPSAFEYYQDKNFTTWFGGVLKYASLRANQNIAGGRPGPLYLPNAARLLVTGQPMA